MDPVAEGLWSKRVDHSFIGLAIGTRCTIVKLSDGGLFVHSPIRLDSALKAEVDALGPVRFVVCPNAYHHLFAEEWCKAFPDARLHGPKTLHAKRKDLSFSGTLEDDAWRDTLIPVHIEGCLLDETVFVHPQTRTLVSSDLTENFRTADDWYTRTYLKLNGTHGVIGWPRLLRPLYRDKKAAKNSLARLVEHDFDRLIIAHGDLIETGAKAALSQTFTFLG
jgi:Domain of unknown function (DUF4336)